MKIIADMDGQTL